MCRSDAGERPRTGTVGGARTRYAAPASACIGPEVAVRTRVMLEGASGGIALVSTREAATNLIRALLPHKRLVARRTLTQVPHVRLAHDALQLPQPVHLQRHPSHLRSVSPSRSFPKWPRHTLRRASATPHDRLTRIHQFKPGRPHLHAVNELVTQFSVYQAAPVVSFLVRVALYAPPLAFINAGSGRRRRVCWMMGVIGEHHGGRRSRGSGRRSRRARRGRRAAHRDRGGHVRGASYGRRAARALGGRAAAAIRGRFLAHFSIAAPGVRSICSVLFRFSLCCRSASFSFPFRAIRFADVGSPRYAIRAAIGCISRVLLFFFFSRFFVWVFVKPGQTHKTETNAG